MSVHVASTATSPLRFVRYDLGQDPRILPRELASVTVKGGANLPDKTLYTPKGVLTEISDKDWAWLCTDGKFLEMVNDGFLTVIGDPRDKDRAVRDLTPKDRCAPKTPADFSLLPNNTDGKGIVVGRTAEEIGRPN